MSRWVFNLLNLIVGILVGFLLAGIAMAHADHNTYGVWKQSQVRVESEPGVDTAEMIRPWNEMAGRELFVIAPVGEKADVNLSPLADYTWVEIKSDGKHMQHCRIHYRRTAIKYDYIMQHEIGHCLGFHDHMKLPDSYGRTTLRQCNKPEEPNYSHYRGVMAYCGWHDPLYRKWRWFGPADIDMMKRYGYRKS